MLECPFIRPWARAELVAAFVKIPRRSLIPLILICVLGALGLGWLAYSKMRRRKPISSDQFTDEFIKGLKAAAPGATVTLQGPMEVHVRDTHGREYTARLDNAYASYVRDPNLRRELLRRHVAAGLEGLRPDAPLDPSRVVPIIKDRKWLVEITRGTDIKNVFDDFNEQLVIVYAEDTPATIRYLTPKILQESGFAKRQLRDLAVANLRQLLREPEVRIGPLVSLISVGGDYEASLLLFDNLWSSGQIKVDGEIVVAVPSRELLLFTGSRNAEGLAKLQELATQAVRESPYSLNDTLFVYRNGIFEKLN
jgi:uncharacterized protein YtpQ (UPF0354 family)